MSNNASAERQSETDTVIDMDSELATARVTQAAQAVERFRQLLLDEAALMKVRNAEDLPGLVHRKHEVITRINEQDQFLRRLFDQHPEHDDVLRLREMLEACRELNRLNRVVAMSELNVTRKSLELLRSLQRMDDLPLYGAAGKLSVVREKRDLGEA